ncbi:MAG TPA: tRNA (adenosine(37)-N6)-threonylcarbamoyltransferase complex dimerization subunit type 1 TsaB [Candidatus Binatia bacterium]|nr:tRNA (adenosine(37)-N6)-threonylcarbamoyltransferase complex dimerization subunit type 1 TsaB [Candidatus Binatia bacterium]
MKVLIIRTDRPEAELGVFEDDKQLAYKKWTADRQLAKTINHEIKEILNKSSIGLEDLQGVIVFKGPGSFTGLRIGMAAANALAYALSVPIVSQSGERWIADGIKRLESGENEKISVPEYGAAANTTPPKK